VQSRQRAERNWYDAYGKRFLDLALGIPAAVLCLPLLAVVAMAVRVALGRPVLFSQGRLGRHARLFTLYKFRTMNDALGRDGMPLPDSMRLTSFGRFLRRTSLDELPELYNVLRGEMSLVGPRPLLLRYLDRYTAEQARRHEVKPGLTGWAQVNGRNAITWEEKFALDVWYVDHCSLRVDLKILVMTLWKVLKREGINSAGDATMPEFMGSDRQVGKE
jgi:lipopolysaccharide/colanic/teichoic acid biosynthesis glycosyltransferase